MLATISTLGPISAARADTIDLDTITVLATMIEERTVEALGGVSVASSETIAQLQPTRLSDILAGMPSVGVTQNADDPATAISIRGLQDFGRVAVIVDGARQNYQRSGHNANGMFYIEPELLSDVQVSRGPVSNIYGSGAIGGVAAFDTKSVDDVLRANETYGALVHGLYGTVNDQLLGSIFLAARPNEDFDVLFGGSYRHLDDYTDGNGNKVTNTGSDTTAGLFKATARPGDGQELKISAMTYDSRYLSGQPDDTGVYDNQTTNSQVVGRYSFASPDNPLIDFVGSAYWTQTQDTQTVKEAYAFDIYTGDTCYTPGVGTCAPFTGDVGTERSFKIDTVGFDVHNTAHIDGLNGAEHAFTVGADLFRDTVAVSGASDPGAPLTPGGERRVYGGFAQWQTDTRWIETIVAMRYDGYSLDSDDYSASGSHFSPKFTIGFKPMDGLKLYGTVAQGYRAPAITETLIDGYHPGDIFYFIPNPTLKPEVGTTYETGVNFSRNDLFRPGDSFRAKGNLFLNNVSNYIDQAVIGYGGPNSDCPVMSAYYFCIQYQNVEQARLYGVELEATYDAVGWFATVSGQHIESENVGTGERLTSAPPDQVALTFGKRFLDGKLTVAPRWQHVWGVTDPSAGTYKPFDLVGLTIAYKPTEDVTAALVLDNLLDAYYVPYLQNLPAPGISAKASLTVRFGGGSRSGG